MIATSSISTGTSGSERPSSGNRPRSNACWVSSGGATLRPAPTSTRMMVMASGTLYGPKRLAMRGSRSGIFGASAFAAFCASAS